MYRNDSQNNESYLGSQEYRQAYKRCTSPTKKLSSSTSSYSSRTSRSSEKPNCHTCSRPSRRDVGNPEYWRRVRSLSKDNKKRMDARESQWRLAEMEEMKRRKEILSRRKKEKDELTNKFMRQPLKLVRNSLNDDDMERRTGVLMSRSVPDLEEAFRTIKQGQMKKAKSQNISGSSLEVWSELDNSTSLISERHVNIAENPQIFLDTKSQKFPKGKVFRENQKAYPTRPIEELKARHSLFTSNNNIPSWQNTKKKKSVKLLYDQSLASVDSSSSLPETRMIIVQKPKFIRRRSMPDLSKCKCINSTVVYESVASLDDSVDSKEMIVLQKCPMPVSYTPVMVSNNKITRPKLNIKNEIFSKNFKSNNGPIISIDNNITDVSNSGKICEKYLRNCSNQQLSKRKEWIAEQMSKKEFKRKVLVNKNISQTQKGNKGFHNTNRENPKSPLTEGNESTYYDSLEEDNGSNNSKKNSFFISVEGEASKTLPVEIPLPTRLTNRMKELENDLRRPKTAFDSPAHLNLRGKKVHPLQIEALLLSGNNEYIEIENLNQINQGRALSVESIFSMFGDEAAKLPQLSNDKILNELRDQINYDSKLQQPNLNRNNIINCNNINSSSIKNSELISKRSTKIFYTKSTTHIVTESLRENKSNILYTNFSNSPSSKLNYHDNESNKLVSENHSIGLENENILESSTLDENEIENEEGKELFTNEKPAGYDHLNDYKMINGTCSNIYSEIYSQVPDNKGQSKPLNNIYTFAGEVDSKIIEGFTGSQSEILLESGFGDDDEGNLESEKSDTPNLYCNEEGQTLISSQNILTQENNGCDLTSTDEEIKVSDMIITEGESLDRTDKHELQVSEVNSEFRHSIQNGALESVQEENEMLPDLQESKILKNLNSENQYSFSIDSLEENNHLIENGNNDHTVTLGNDELDNDSILQNLVTNNVNISDNKVNLCIANDSCKELINEEESQYETNLTNKDIIEDLSSKFEDNDYITDTIKEEEIATHENEDIVSSESNMRNEKREDLDLETNDEFVNQLNLEKVNPNDIEEREVISEDNEINVIDKNDAMKDYDSLNDIESLIFNENERFSEENIDEENEILTPKQIKDSEIFFDKERVISDLEISENISEEKECTDDKILENTEFNMDNADSELNGVLYSECDESKSVHLSSAAVLCKNTDEDVNDLQLELLGNGKKDFLEVDETEENELNCNHILERPETTTREEAEKNIEVSIGNIDSNLDYKEEEDSTDIEQADYRTSSEKRDNYICSNNTKNDSSLEVLGKHIEISKRIARSGASQNKNEEMLKEASDKFDDCFEVKYINRDHVQLEIVGKTIEDNRNSVHKSIVPNGKDTNLQKLKDGEVENKSVTNLEVCGKNIHKKIADIELLETSAKRNMNIKCNKEFYITQDNQEEVIFSLDSDENDENEKYNVNDENEDENNFNLESKQNINDNVEENIKTMIEKEFEENETDNLEENISFDLKELSDITDEEDINCESEEKNEHDEKEECYNDESEQNKIADIAAIEENETKHVNVEENEERENIKVKGYNNLAINNEDSFEQLDNDETYAKDGNNKADHSNHDNGDTDESESKTIDEVYENEESKNKDEKNDASEYGKESFIENGDPNTVRDGDDDLEEIVYEKNCDNEEDNIGNNIEHEAEDNEDRSESIKEPTEQTDVENNNIQGDFVDEENDCNEENNIENNNEHETEENKEETESIKILTEQNNITQEDIADEENNIENNSEHEVEETESIKELSEQNDVENGNVQEDIVDEEHSNNNEENNIENNNKHETEENKEETESIEELTEQNDIAQEDIADEENYDKEENNIENNSEHEVEGTESIKELTEQNNVENGYVQEDIVDVEDGNNEENNNENNNEHETEENEEETGNIEELTGQDDVENDNVQEDIVDEGNDENEETNIENNNEYETEENEEVTECMKKDTEQNDDENDSFQEDIANQENNDDDAENNIENDNEHEADEETGNIEELVEENDNVQENIIDEGNDENEETNIENNNEYETEENEEGTECMKKDTEQNDDENDSFQEDIANQENNDDDAENNIEKDNEHEADEETGNIEELVEENDNVQENIIDEENDENEETNIENNNEYETEENEEGTECMKKDTEQNDDENDSFQEDIANQENDDDSENNIENDNEHEAEEETGNIEELVEENDVENDNVQENIIDEGKDENEETNIENINEYETEENEEGIKCMKKDTEQNDDENDSFQEDIANQENDDDAKNNIENDNEHEAEENSCGTACIKDFTEQSNVENGYVQEDIVDEGNDDNEENDIEHNNEHEAEENEHEQENIKELTEENDVEDGNVQEDDNNSCIEDQDMASDDIFKNKPGIEQDDEADENDNRGTTDHRRVQDEIPEEEIQHIKEDNEQHDDKTDDLQGNNENDNQYKNNDIDSDNLESENATDDLEGNKENNNENKNNDTYSNRLESENTQEIFHQVIEIDDNDNHEKSENVNLQDNRDDIHDEKLNNEVQENFNQGNNEDNENLVEIKGSIIEEECENVEENNDQENNTDDNLTEIKEDSIIEEECGYIEEIIYENEDTMYNNDENEDTMYNNDENEDTMYNNDETELNIYRDADEGKRYITDQDNKIMVDVIDENNASSEYRIKTVQENKDDNGNHEYLHENVDEENDYNDDDEINITTENETVESDDGAETKIQNGKHDNLSTDTDENNDSEKAIVSDQEVDNENNDDQESIDNSKNMEESNDNIIESIDQVYNIENKSDQGINEEETIKETVDILNEEVNNKRQDEDAKDEIIDYINEDEIITTTLESVTSMNNDKKYEIHDDNELKAVNEKNNISELENDDDFQTEIENIEVSKENKNEDENCYENNITENENCDICEDETENAEEIIECEDEVEGKYFKEENLDIVESKSEIHNSNVSHLNENITDADFDNNMKDLKSQKIEYKEDAKDNDSIENDTADALCSEGDEHKIKEIENNDVDCSLQNNTEDGSESSTSSDRVTVIRNLIGSGRNSLSANSACTPSDTEVDHSSEICTNVEDDNLPLDSKQPLSDNESTYDDTNESSQIETINNMKDEVVNENLEFIKKIIQDSRQKIIHNLITTGNEHSLKSENKDDIICGKVNYSFENVNKNREKMEINDRHLIDEDDLYFEAADEDFLHEYGLILDEDQTECGSVNSRSSDINEDLTNLERDLNANQAVDSYSDLSTIEEETEYSLEGLDDTKQIEFLKNADSTNTEDGKNLDMDIETQTISAIECTGIENNDLSKIYQNELFNDSSDLLSDDENEKTITEEVINRCDASLNENNSEIVIEEKLTYIEDRGGGNMAEENFNDDIDNQNLNKILDTNSYHKEAINEISEILEAYVASENFAEITNIKIDNLTLKDKCTRIIDTDMQILSTNLESENNHEDNNEIDIKDPLKDDALSASIEYLTEEETNEHLNDEEFTESISEPKENDITDEKYDTSEKDDSLKEETFGIKKDTLKADVFNKERTIFKPNNTIRDANICDQDEDEEDKYSSDHLLSDEITLSSEDMTKDMSFNIQNTNLKTDYYEELSKISNLEVNDNLNSTDISEMEECKDESEVEEEELRKKPNLFNNTLTDVNAISNLGTEYLKSFDGLNKRISNFDNHFVVKSVKNQTQLTSNISHQYLNDQLKKVIGMSSIKHSNSDSTNSANLKPKKKKNTRENKNNANTNLSSKIKAENLSTGIEVCGRKVISKQKKTKSDALNSSSLNKSFASEVSNQEETENSNYNNKLKETCMTRRKYNTLSEVPSYSNITQRSNPSEQGETASTSKSPSSDSGVMELAGPSRNKNAQETENLANSSSIETKEDENYSDQDPQDLHTVLENRDNFPEGSDTVSNNNSENRRKLDDKSSETTDGYGELPNTPVYSDSETSSMFRRKFIYNYLGTLNNGSSGDNESEEHSSEYDILQRPHLRLSSDDESESNNEYTSRLLKAFETRRRRRHRNRPPHIDVEESLKEGYKPPSLSNFDSFLASLSSFRNKRGYLMDREENDSVSDTREIKVEVCSGNESHDIKVSADNKIRILVEVAPTNFKNNDRAVPKQSFKRTSSAETHEDYRRKHYHQTSSSSLRRTYKNVLKKQTSYQENFHTPIINNFVEENSDLRKDKSRKSPSIQLSNGSCGISVEGNNIQKCFTGPSHSASRQFLNVTNRVAPDHSQTKKIEKSAEIREQKRVQSSIKAIKALLKTLV